MNSSGTLSRAGSSSSYADLSGQIQLDDDRPVFDGNYSKVYKGILNGRPVAVKVLKHIPGKNDESMERKMTREMKLWAEQEHDFVSEFLGGARGPEFGSLGALVSRWYANGDSHSYLEARKDTLNYWDRADLFHQVVEGLVFLHKNGIIHGDIKPGNVLIDDDGRPRLSDFGLATLLQEEPGSGLTTTSEYTGTPRYLAIELLTSESTPPTAPSDVWAVGCLGLEYLFQTMPYSHRPNNNRGVIYQDIKNGILPHPIPETLNVYTGMWQLLHLCWKHQPRTRPSAVDVATLTGLLRGVESSPDFDYKRIQMKWAPALVVDLAYIARQLQQPQSREEESVMFFVMSKNGPERKELEGSPYVSILMRSIFAVLSTRERGGNAWMVESLHRKQRGLVKPAMVDVCTPESLLERYPGKQNWALPPAEKSLWRKKEEVMTSASEPRQQPIRAQVASDPDSEGSDGEVTLVEREGRRR